MDEAVRDELEDLCSLVSAEIEAACGSVEGQCLPGALGLVCHAKEHPELRDMDMQVVKGAYGSEAHWWVEADGEIFDPTEDQFAYRAAYQPFERIAAEGESFAKLRESAREELAEWGEQTEQDVSGITDWLGLAGDDLSLGM
jgi:hypothetical protein